MNETHVVNKWGGSALATAPRFRRAAGLILADSRRDIVVVSAPGKRKAKDEKITDLLIGWHKAQNGDESEKRSALAIRKIIEKRYSRIASELGLSLRIKDEMDAIDEEVQKGASRAYVESRGEFLCAKIMAELLDFRFVDAKDHIFFNRKGELQKKRTLNSLRKVLSKGRVVLPGYYGRGPDGEIQTFSRGGSDITGALAAQAVRAILNENWTDVNGVKEVSPKIEESAPTIREMTYSQLVVMGDYGAAVFHKSAVEPVAESGIPTRIRNAFDADNEGTLVVPDSPDVVQEGFVGIAGKGGYVALRITKNLMNDDVGITYPVYGVFKKHGIAYQHSPTTSDAVTIVFHRDQLLESAKRYFSGVSETGHITERMLEKKAAHIQKDIEDDIKRISTKIRASYLSPMALISVIESTGEIAHTNEKIYASLRRDNIVPRLTSQESPTSITIAVDEADLESAIRGIYHTFHPTTSK